MPSARASTRGNREEIVLWTAALTPVFAWIAAQQLDFLLSAWVCATGNRWVFHAVTALALLAAAAGGTVSWRRWKELPAEKGREDRVRSRHRFLAGGGLVLAAVFLTAIVALAIPTIVHRPCD